MEDRILAKIEPHCRTQVHCEMCRAKTSVGEKFRKSYLEDKDGECPFGVPWNMGATDFQKLLRALRIGDKIESAAKKLGIPTCCKCKSRKRKWNGE